MTATAELEAPMTNEELPTGEATSAPIRKSKKSKKGDIAKITPKATVIAPNETIKISEIVSNKMNPRRPLPILQNNGWGLFEKLPDTDKPSLISLALSEDPKQRKEFIKQIDEFQPDIREQAESDKKVSQLQNIVVRFTPEGKYDLIIGARRVFARLYAYCAWDTEPTLVAKVIEVDDQNARLMAFDENFKRKDADPIETGLMLAQIKREYEQKHGKCSADTLESLTGIKWQTVNGLILLATSKKITEEQRLKISNGELPRTKALEIIKGKDNPARPQLNPNGAGNKVGGGRRPAPSLKSLEKAYATGVFQFLDVKGNVIDATKSVKADASSDEVHAFLSVLLQIPKKDFRTLAQIKAALDKESK